MFLYNREKGGRKEGRNKWTKGGFQLKNKCLYLTSFTIDLPIKCASPKHCSELSFPALKLQSGCTVFYYLSFQLLPFPLHWPSAFSCTMSRAVIHTCSCSLSSFQLSSQHCFACVFYMPFSCCSPLCVFYSTLSSDKNTNVYLQGDQKLHGQMEVMSNSN